MEWRDPGWVIDRPAGRSLLPARPLALRGVLRRSTPRCSTSRQGCPMMFRRLPHLLFGLVLAVLSHAALAQIPGGPPPSVGVVKAETRPMTEASEFVGRIQAVG